MRFILTNNELPSWFTKVTERMCRLKNPNYTWYTLIDWCSGSQEMFEKLIVLSL